MAHYKLLAFSDATNGQEQEYNDWYTNQHLHDVVAVPGINAAQRFKLSKVVAGEFVNKYLTIYEVESDHPEEVIEELNRRGGTDAMIISDAMNLDSVSLGIFETISSRITAPKLV